MDCWEVPSCRQFDYILNIRIWLPPWLKGSRVLNRGWVQLFPRFHILNIKGWNFRYHKTCDQQMSTTGKFRQMNSLEAIKQLLMTASLYDHRTFSKDFGQQIWSVECQQETPVKFRLIWRLMNMTSVKDDVSLKKRDHSLSLWVKTGGLLRGINWVQFILKGTDHATSKNCYNSLLTKALIN